MPVAAVAVVVRATYHSNTADAARRDGCSMVRLRVPGFALAISTGDPAFRLQRLSPDWTINERTQRKCRESGCLVLRESLERGWNMG